MKQAIVIIYVSLLWGCFGAEPQKTGKEGKVMPEFSLLLTDSTTRLHSRDFAEKPTVLLYFSPFCPYCKAQTNTIVENIENLKDIQFYFISSYPLNTVKEFIKEHKLKKYGNITVALDSSRFISDYFEIPGIPYVAIYGKNKKLNKTFLGKVYSSQIKKIAEE